MARSESRRALAFVGACGVAVAILAACNGIIGLDDFTRGECPGAYCGRDVDVVDATDANDGGPIPRGSDPVSWAKWRMPNYVVDGGTLPNLPSYEVQGDVVVDKVTTLVWRRAPLSSTSKQADAESACRAQSNGPWRLPRRIELVTLLDYGQTQYAIDPAAFPEVDNIPIWTSSPVRPTTTAEGHPYWVVDFKSGQVTRLPANDKANVLCVKASQ